MGILLIIIIAVVIFVATPIIDEIVEDEIDKLNEDKKEL